MKIITAKNGILQILVLNLIGSCIVFGGPNISKGLDRSAESPIKNLNSTYKLPSNTRPIEYWLEINPNIITGKFKGEVTILISADANTEKIILHSVDLVIGNVCVWSHNDNDERKIESSYDIKPYYNTLNIRTNESIEGYYFVIVTFEGVLEKHYPFGFALYRGIGEQIEYTAGTLFEPIFARTTFPCYDEPQFRTPFTLTILKRSNEIVRSITHYTSSANESSSSKELNRETKVEFAKTDPIPTHVLAYAIFDNKGYYENTSPYSGIYTIWSRKNAQNQVSYALEMIPAIVEGMVDFTDVPLSSPEMDFVTIPSEMGRNKRTDETRWESMFYIERDILCDVDECSQAYQQRVTTNLVRQISYEWFGKYVSIESWKDFWLKHGFAKYFQFELTEKIDPSWELSDFHGSLQMQTTLFVDNSYMRDPLSNAENLTAREIFQMYKYWPFKFLSDKAALIIRMLEHIVGKFTFKRAIQRFLNVSREKLGGLITSADLWVAFDDQLKADEQVLPMLPDSNPRPIKSVSSIMEPYTTLPGYPLIKANKISEHGISFNQSPYVDIKRKDSIWYVPITITTRSESNFQSTLPLTWSITNTTTFMGVRVQNDEWYIVNVKNTAYCRIHYIDDNWKLLIKQLHDDPTEIHRLNRAQLIADSHQLAFDGQISFFIPIVLSTYLYKEKDPTVWMTAFRSFKRFYATVSEALRPLYQEHFVKCLEHEYKRTGFEIKTDDTRATKMWRSEMLSFLCWIGHSDCVQKAKGIYQEHISDLTAINADLQYVVWCTMLRIDSNALSNKNFIRNLKNMLCREEVFNVASYCSLSPTKNENGMSYIYENLSTNLLAKEMNDVCTSVVEMMTNHWDFVASILKMIENEVDKLRKKLSFITNTSKIEKLTKLVRCLYGMISGKVEFDAIERILTKANSLDSYVFIELQEAIRNTRSSANSSGINIQEDILETILRIHECPEVENDGSYEDKNVQSSLEIALKFFDENITITKV